MSQGTLLIHSRLSLSRISYTIFILDSEVGMKKTTTPQLIPQWNDENAIIHENVLSKANANANNVVGSGQYYYV